MKRKPVFYWISLVFCTLGLLASSGMLLCQWTERRTAETAYQSLTERVITLPEASEDMGENSAQTPPEAQSPESSLPQVDFDALKAINPHTVGWLYCPDTDLSYPVVQGEDNDYYLHHLFDGTRNRAGCLFLDSSCQGLDGQNSIIYGHNMKNNTQFAFLENYKNQSYYDAHPTLFLLTPEGTLTIELFSAYVTETDGNAWALRFSSDEEYETWLTEIQSRSCFDSHITPSPTDRVITLSTCDYTFKDAHFVCHGLVREETGS